MVHRGRAGRRSLATIVAGTLLAFVALAVAATGGTGAPSARAAGYGLVSTSHPLAAEAGAEMLRRGGNAIDAAAAAQFALNVVEPQYSGIGGGGFLMLYEARTGRTLALDGRETAPAAATPDQFLDRAGRPLSFGQAHMSGQAVGVPGTIRLLETVLARHGRLSLAETLEPAVDLAEYGFPVNGFLAADIASGWGKLAARPASRAAFLPRGQAPRAGYWLRQPDLAGTFRLLQEQGSAAFYQGEIAGAIVAAVGANGGTMSRADLAGYRVQQRAPVWGDYRGYQIASMPPPSSGGLTLLQTFGLIDGYDLWQYGHNSAPGLHRLIEAMRLAYADRAVYMGDGDFAHVPVRGLLHPDYVAERRASIDPRHANRNPQPGNPYAYEPDAVPTLPPASIGNDGQHTSHLVVVDANGNVVSFTTTIEAAWGTGIVVPGYGFLLNNELTDFDFVPGGANQVEPGKRPRSSMTPTIVFQNGEPVFALGSPGGPTIISTVAQVLLNVLEHGMDVQSAINAPRIYAPEYPSVTWEAGVPPATLRGLRAYGHQPIGGASRLGSVQAALRDANGFWIGGADPRREGTVVYVE